MNRSSGLPRELPAGITGTTPSNYGGGAVYRSLALPTATIGNPEIFRPVEKPSVSQSKLVGSTTISQKQDDTLWDDNKKDGQQKEPKPVPIPFIVSNTPFTGLFLQSDPVSLVVNEIHSLFERHEVDVTFVEREFKWKCACYVDQCETRFCCRLFATPDSTNYFVLDFQRLFGDPFLFRSIHNAMNMDLVKSGFVVSCKGEKKVAPPSCNTTKRVFKPMALPPDFFSSDSKTTSQQDEEEKDSEDFEPLCNMCTSSFIDVQREGLHCLTSQLLQKTSTKESLTPFTGKLLHAMATTQDDQVRRLAASAIAAISSEPKAQAEIATKDGLLALANVLFSEDEVVETRRQAATAISNTLNRNCALNKDVKATIRHANIIAKDARLNRIVRDIQAKIA